MLQFGSMHTHTHTHTKGRDGGYYGNTNVCVIVKFFFSGDL